MSSMVVLLSGGLDSTVLANWLKRNGEEIIAALFVNYGQDAAMRELYSARRTSLKLNIPLEIVDIPNLRYVMWGLWESEYHAMMAESRVAPTSGCNCGDRSPADAIGATYTVLRGAKQLLIGSMADDLKPIPQLKDYIRNFSASIRDLHGVQFELVAPFIDKTKADLISLAHEMGTDLSQAWCCYKSSAQHCGKCPGCKKRKEAFIAAGKPDTASYES